MNTVTTIAVVIAQTAVLLLSAPLLSGVMRQVRARIEGRAGSGAMQQWRDLRKLLRREPTSADGTSWVFIAAPVVLMASSLGLAALIPYLSPNTGAAAYSNLFAIVSLLLLGTVALVLAGIDTGTAFGGMGASREITIAALVEPTVLLSIFAMSVPTGSSNLAQIVAARVEDPALIGSPGSVLALISLIIMTIAETGRLPIDNPSTHLELTMVHEAMTLEYSGRDLALVEWASSLRLACLLGLIATLFFPWGVALTATAASTTIAVALLIGKILVLGIALAVIEVFLAKLRLFRVPELLAGSLVIAFLAVTCAYFIPAVTGAT